MPVNAIDATGTAVGTAQSAQERGLSTLKSEDFFKILITEMQSQDPFEPSDTQDIINQVSQIRTIEQSAKLTDTLDTLTQQQRMGGTTELIGKYVQAIAGDSQGNAAIVEGVVTGVVFTGDGVAVLELDNGAAVPAADVVRVASLGSDGQPIAMAAAEQDETEEKSGLTERTRDVLWGWMDKLLEPKTSKR